MDISQLRQKFVEFFNQNGYQALPPSSLVPKNDPSVLFTTAGMQQFKDYYLHPESAPVKKAVTIQPVIRTSDIAEVGDDTHLTSFEMLGNFCFAQSDITKLKKESITEAWEFISKELGVDSARVHTTIFEGDETTPTDKVSEQVWQQLGIKVIRANREENFWGPTGLSGPCGPTTEIYVDGIEVWNLVFNEYFCNEEGNLSPLDHPGLDTGSGLERLAATLQGKKSVWEIDPFSGWVKSLDINDEKSARIIIDHLRASLFLISAGIIPANKGREYILRRLIRKTVFLSGKSTKAINYQQIFEEMIEFYPTYKLFSVEKVWPIFLKEKEQFEKNLVRAENYLEKWLSSNKKADEKEITKLAFYMYESFGFPKELVIEHLASLDWKVDVDHFEELFIKHQEVSRAGLEKQFKGGLADHEEQTIKHHTAHHLLLAALREVLGDNVVQRGSNVTKERLRIDFSFDHKLTDDEIKKVEKIVNKKISENIPVEMEEMELDLALKTGALAEFGTKYGNVVSVYSIGDFSKELCGGPHAKTTGELGQFKILKEEASSQGVRRIKAKLD